MSQRRAFGELELAILRTFKGGEKLSVRDVITALGCEDKYTTIMTVMNRLADKGVLLRERNGKQYDYWVPASKKSGSHTVLGRIKQALFGGNAIAMASYLIEKGDMTDSDLLEMEKLIKEVRKTRTKG